MPNPITITFTGEVTFPEAPDDRGSIDNWLINELEMAVEKGRNTETGLGVLKLLHLSWRVKK